MGGSFFSSGISETRASVVSIRDAIEPAFCRAVRVTLVGSMTPALTRSSNLSGLGVVAEVVLLRLADAADDDGTFFAGVADDLTQGLFESAAHDVAADLLVAFQLQGFDGSPQRSSATPPPGTMPSSTAARVACIASSTRAFFSFISVSVAAPTLMTATPPTSFANRSCNFSRS